MSDPMWLVVVVGVAFGLIFIALAVRNRRAGRAGAPLAARRVRTGGRRHRTASGPMAGSYAYSSGEGADCSDGGSGATSSSRSGGGGWGGWGDSGGGDGGGGGGDGGGGG
jgi:hypothetical protein